MMVIRRLGMVAHAAAGEDVLGRTRSPSGGPQSGVQDQSQGIADQVGGHLLHKPTGIEVTGRRCRPSAALLLLAGAWQLRTSVPLLGALLRIWSELGLQEAGYQVLGEG